jgi:hypothetical protein
MKKTTALGLSIGLLVGAIALAVLGTVLSSKANFADHYVREQMQERGIVFTPVANLLPQQKTVKCLVDNAGKPLLTGKQAECYATYQIGIDLTVVDNGKTYFQDHYNGYLARVAAAQALQANPNAPETAVLVKKATDIQRTADDLLAGEATRGLLLTAYGFSVFGDLGHQAAITCYVLTGLLTIGAVAAFAVSRRSPRGRDDGSRTSSTRSPSDLVGSVS